MKTKHLAVLLFTLAALAVVGVLINRLKAPRPPEGRFGTLLVEHLPVNEIVSITIRGPEKKVSLVKREDLWVVEDRFDFPADFSKIRDLVKRVKDAKVGRHFESSEDLLRRLSLKRPEDDEAVPQEKGILIHMKGTKETNFINILLGKTRKSDSPGALPEGQYVMLDEESRIYLIDKDFSSFDKDPAAWLNKDLVKVKPDEVKKISCLSADGKKIRYSFERPEKGKEIQPVDFPAKAKVKKSAVNRLVEALSTFRIQDVLASTATPGSAGDAFPAVLEYHLFNGILYRLYPSRLCTETAPCYLRLEVDYEAFPAEEKEGDERIPSEIVKEGTKKSPEEYALEAKQLNDRLSPWVYLIPKWQNDAFITNPEQLTEESGKGQEKKQGS